MENVEVCLVKPKIGILTEVRAYLAHDFDVLDLNHQMYVSNRFVFGHFKERKEGFVLHSPGIYYAEASQQDFADYTNDLEAQKLEVVLKFFIPNINLERLMQETQTYLTAKKNIVEIVNPLQKYF